jgi:hypothetical protein
LAQANWRKQIGWVNHCRQRFLRKNQCAFLARLDFTTHSPYIMGSQAFLPVFDIMVAVR